MSLAYRMEARVPAGRPSRLGRGTGDEIGADGTGA